MLIFSGQNPVHLKTPPTDVKTQFIYRCATPYCGHTAIQEYLGLTPLMFSSPGNGWKYIGGQWYCPAHEVKMQVDGKEVTE